MRTTNVLFLYGTLLSGARSAMGREERQRLAREGTMLGEAFVRGRLYSLGDYPALVLSGGGSVLGEAVLLRNPWHTLRWLDAYEGITARTGRNGVYQRIQAAIEFASGKTSAAWLYVVRRRPSASVVVPHGRWLAVSAARRHPMHPATTSTDNKKAIVIL